MTEITNEDFEKSIISNKNVIIEFSASWCGPCRTMHPILEEIDNTNDKISVFEVNVDEEVDLCTQFGVRNIPTTLYYKNGILLTKTTGSQTKEKILQMFYLSNR